MNRNSEVVPDDIYRVSVIATDMSDGDTKKMTSPREWGMKRLQEMHSHSFQ